MLIANTNHHLPVVVQKEIEDTLNEYKEIFSQLPKNTQKAYNSDMKLFLQWCVQKGYSSFKPDFDHNKTILKAYFSYQIENNLARATISRSKAPLSKFISLLKWPNPFDDMLFKEWLRVNLNKRPAFQDQATALTHDLLAQLNFKLDDECPLQLRDKVMVNIMFDGLLRASEVCSLKCKDIDFKAKLLFLASSKTDQEGKGAYRVLSQTTLSLITLWKSNFGIFDGFLLRSLTPVKNITERELKYDQVYRAYKRLALMLDVDSLSTHSARVGGAVTLAEHDCNMLEIQHAGGWKSASMPARYTEQVNVRKNGMGKVIDKIGR